ncbi:dTDP-4-dehydrorhamnose reductase [candidate division WOR-3 bacterium]|nr:dTDP-4-dehydrorhamnose reductase [candidate division WOR-3 bacterium]
MLFLPLSLKVFEDIRSPRILITGAEGQLGSELADSLAGEYEVIAVDKKDFDISKFKAVNSFIMDTRPNGIIHSAAFTDVDKCEKEKEKAFKVNAIGTRNLAIAAKKVDAKFFYISTDYVFDGEKDGVYYEYDAPNPKTIYGMSKLLGENFVREQLNRFFIMRIGWLYGTNGVNFIKKMIDLAKKKKKIQVVNDQFGSPTWTFNVIEQIKKLMPTDFYGTYHATCQGSCSWFEFACEIFKNIGYVAEVKDCKSLNFKLKTKSFIPGIQKDFKLLAIESNKLKNPARRPKNSALENYMLKLQNLDIMPHWKESLASFLDTLKT